MSAAWPVRPVHPAIPGALWEALGPLVTRPGRRVAAFDADGTLWAGDVGEAHLAWLDRQGVIPPPAPHGSLMEAYLDTCARDAGSAYVWACTVMAGMEEPRVVETARGAWEGHRAHVFEPLRALVGALGAAGVEVWVVSASNRWVVTVGAAELGVPPERVLALAVHVEGGRLSERVVTPVPNGPGKVAALEAHVGVRPIFAAGNSLHDAPMLEAAEVALLVGSPGSRYATAALAERAARGGWFSADPSA